MFLLVTCLELIHPNMIISDYLEKTLKTVEIRNFYQVYMDGKIGHEVEILFNLIFPSFEARLTVESSSGQDN